MLLFSLHVTNPVFYEREDESPLMSLMLDLFTSLEMLDEFAILPFRRRRLDFVPAL